MAIPQDLNLSIRLCSVQGFDWVFFVDHGRYSAYLPFCSVFISSSRPFSFSACRFDSSFFDVHLGDALIQLPDSEFQKFKSFLAEVQTAKEAV